MPVSSTTNRVARRRGVALVWVGLMMVVLLGFVALGIDVGRVHLARSELQSAADGAARAAVWPVPDLRFADGQARARAVIQGNAAGGGAIGYAEADDLEYGIWWRSTRTFQPISTPANLVYANAARVTTHRDAARSNPLPTTFAQAIGFDDVNISASSIAMIRGGWRYRGHGFGLVGLDWVRTNGTTMTDSYNPNNGPYDPNAANDGGGIGTNGYITLVGTTDIGGDARYGPDAGTSPSTDYIQMNPNASVTGWQAPLDAELVYPPATIPSVYNNAPLRTAGLLDNRNNITLTGKASVTIPGGTPENPNVYVVNNVTIRSNTTVSVNGAIKLYVTGDIDMTGNILVNDSNGVSNPLPANFQIFVVGSGSVNIGGGSALYARVYAPESDVVIHGTGDEAGLFGAVVGKTLDVKGNSGLHYDESTDWNVQPEMDEFWVELVR